MTWARRWAARGKIYFSPAIEHHVTPRGVLRYKLDDISSVYASFSEGYKSGFRNISAPSNALIEPEKLYAYEVGYKLAQQAFALNVAAYYYNYVDMQVGSYHGDIEIVNNAAKSRIYGLDADLRYAFTSHFELTAAADYTHAVYVYFPGAPSYVQCLQVACGLGSFPTETLDLHNSPMQFAPRFTGNIGARYTTPLAGGKIALSGNLGYVARQYYDAAAEYAVRRP